MDISVNGLCELANYECCCLRPYLDSGGIKTVGIGSTQSDIPDLSTWPWDKELTIKEAVDLYRKGLTKYISAVNKALKVPVAQNVFDALVSITYNIGVGGMAKSTFMKRLNDGRALKHVTEAMSWWNQDNGVVVKGLINRRAKEAKLILTGQYDSKGLVSLAPVVGKKPQYSKAKLIKLADYL